LVIVGICVVAGSFALLLAMQAAKRRINSSARSKCLHIAIRPRDRSKRLSPTLRTACPIPMRTSVRL
jgi:hypothetical protein